MPSVAMLLLLLVGCPTEAHAQKCNNVELFFAGGFLSVDGGISPEGPSPDVGEVTASIRPGSPYGFSTTFRSCHTLALEISLGMFTSDYVVDFYTCDPSGYCGFLSGEHTTEEFLLHFNAVLNPVRGPIEPYLSAGLGWIAFVDKAAFSQNAGVGLRLFLTSHFGLRCEARVFRTNLNDTIEASMCPECSVYASADYSDEFIFRQMLFGIVIRL